MNKEQAITRIEEIIYTYEEKAEYNKLSEFEEGRLSAFRFSLSLIKKIDFIQCCKSDSELLFAFLKYHYKGGFIDPTDEELKKYIEIYLSK